MLEGWQICTLNYSNIKFNIGDYLEKETSNNQTTLKEKTTLKLHRGTFIGKFKEIMRELIW